VARQRLRAGGGAGLVGELRPGPGSAGVRSGAEGALLGHALGTLDVTGDGLADVAVGAVSATRGDDGEGQVWLLSGTTSGLGTVPDWIADGNQAYAWLGWSVAGADVDGDGYGDLLVGAASMDVDYLNEGRAVLFRGSSSGLERLDGWTLDGDQGAAGFGMAVAGAGDVNGDGYDDVLVGAPDYDAGEVDEGRAFLFDGSANGLLGVASWVSDGGQAGASHGVAVAGAGDVDGDGYTDLLVGADRFDGTFVNGGRAALYRGGPKGPATVPTWTVEGSSTGARLGQALAGAGDVNGDGFADLLVAAPAHEETTSDEGRVLVFHGSATGPAASPDWLRDGGQADMTFGGAVAAIGDVNADGFGDVAIGAPGAANGSGAVFVQYGSASGLASAPDLLLGAGKVDSSFGAAVAGAGDVNGDGYDDLLVGAPTSSLGDEGVAIVYAGGSAGLDPSALWFREGDDSFVYLGVSVAGAGDVDGDGHADILVRSDTDRPHFDLGVMLIGGSPTGPAATLAWQSPPGWGAGASMAGAGDVNGDGFADMVFGGNEAIWVLYGSSAGLGGHDTGGDTGGPTDTSDTGVAPHSTDTGTPSTEPEDEKTGCGCASGPSGSGSAVVLLGAIAAMGAVRRRHPRGASAG
jgi:MYXO-CTERM domain-containing protein